MRAMLSLTAPGCFTVFFDWQSICGNGVAGSSRNREVWEWGFVHNGADYVDGIWVNMRQGGLRVGRQKRQLQTRDRKVVKIKKVVRIVAVVGALFR